MKRLFLGMLLLMMAVGGHVYAYYTEVKYYLPPQNVRLQGGAILVYLGKEWVVTNALYSDGGGLYIFSPSMVCNYCGQVNSYYTVFCEGCGLLSQ